MNKFSTVLTVAMLIIFSTMVAVTTTYPPGAQFMPYIVGIPGIVLCLIQLGSDLRAFRGARLAGNFEAAPRAGEHSLPGQELPEFGPHTVRAEITTWIYVVCFLLGIVFFGFLVAVPIMVITYLWREASAKPLQAILAGIICTGVMYVMFEKVFHLQLHQGLITPTILRFIGL
jgi:hypothetical protein